MNNYTDFGSPPGRKTRTKKGEPLEYARMTFTRDKRSGNNVIVIYPHQDAYELIGSLKELGARISSDKKKILLRAPQKGDTITSLRKPKQAKPVVYIQVYIPVTFDYQKKERDGTTCEAHFNEQENGWEFHIIDAIKFPVKLKTVSTATER
jgi:hypothetical protein